MESVIEIYEKALEAGFQVTVSVLCSTSAMKPITITIISHVYISFGINGIDKLRWES